MAIIRSKEPWPTSKHKGTQQLCWTTAEDPPAVTGPSLAKLLSFFCRGTRLHDAGCFSMRVGAFFSPPLSLGCSWAWGRAHWYSWVLQNWTPICTRPEQFRPHTHAIESINIKSSDKSARPRSPFDIFPAGRKKLCSGLGIPQSKNQANNEPESLGEAVRTSPFMWQPVGTDFSC